MVLPLRVVSFGGSQKTLSGERVCFLGEIAGAQRLLPEKFDAGSATSAAIQMLARHQRQRCSVRLK